MYQAQGRTFLAITGSLVTCYCVAVLAHVVTSPDLRLRCLLADVDSQSRPGVLIESNDGVIAWAETTPKVGDRIVRINDQPITNFMVYSNQVMGLNRADILAGGDHHVDDPKALRPQLEHYPLPPLLSTTSGRRIVRVDILRPESNAELTTWLEVQSQPLGSVVMTIVWFLFELGITLVGAFAFWKRPFDRSARQFLSMCIVTMAAFVGGYHWWAIAGSLWLNIPFVVCACLLPVVTLHFFLMYPRPKPVLSRRPVSLLFAIYTIPVLALLMMVGLIVTITHSVGNGGVSPSATPDSVLTLLIQLRTTIYAYVTVSGIYFLLTQIALIHGFFTTRNPIEHKQVKAIMWAGIIAMPPLGYTLYLAHDNPVAFALGDSRLPMFMASVSFMLAYAYGILRYKLMLTDQLVTRGMLYYVVTFSVTGFMAMLVAGGMIIPHLTDQSLTLGQESVLYFMLVVMILLLVGLRDRVQRFIDRRFFREKYQLDKALQRVNRAIGNLVDQDALAEMMLNSSCEVLQVNRAALYLRNSNRTAVTLAAVNDMKSIPVNIPNFDEIVEELRDVGTLQRVVHASRDEMSPAQRLLHEFHAELLHGLEVNDNFAGLVVLGAKKGGGQFTAEDLTFLHATSQITNVALYGARLNQDMNRLNEELQLKVERVAEQRRHIAMLQAELSSTRGEEIETDAPTETETETAEFRRGAMKGDSPAIQQVLSMVQKVATSGSSVLIRGESGTGKEVLAQVIHDNSPRRDGELVCVHCASLSPSLLESELFGHVKGAFTGAHQNKIGRFEAANGGTLFLDEIGDISLETQVKLLRVLQERKFEPVGGTRSVEVDVRLLTATHQNIEKLIADGRFREDLYYRLNVISVQLPPLRDRIEDIIELAMHFLRKSAERVGKVMTRIDDDALSALETHAWPGNIRELENVVERAVVLSNQDRITLADLPPELFSPANRVTSAVSSAALSRSPRSDSLSPRADEVVRTSERVETAGPANHASTRSGATSTFRRKTLNENERELLISALDDASGNKAEAARLLGIPRSTFYSKLRKYSIS